MGTRIQLRHWPDNRRIVETLGPLQDQWGWVCEWTAFEFECGEDEVGTAETDDGLLLITVRGEAVARVQKEYRGPL